MGNHEKAVEAYELLFTNDKIPQDLLAHPFFKRNFIHHYESLSGNETKLGVVPVNNGVMLASSKYLPDATNGVYVGFASHDEIRFTVEPKEDGNQLAIATKGQSQYRFKNNLVGGVDSSSLELYSETEEKVKDNTTVVLKDGFAGAFGYFRFFNGCNYTNNNPYEIINANDFKTCTRTTLTRLKDGLVDVKNFEIVRGNTPEDSFEHSLSGYATIDYERPESLNNISIHTLLARKEHHSKDPSLNFSNLDSLEGMEAINNARATYAKYLEENAAKKTL